MKRTEFLTKPLNSGVKLKYGVHDARTVEILTANGLQISEELDNGKITAININELKIAVGLEFSVGIQTIPSSYKIDSIEKGLDSYTLFTHKRNLCSYYLMPLLGIDSISLNKENFNKGYVINSYISEDYSKIYILSRFSTYERYDEFEKELTNNKQFVRVSHPEKGLDLFEFNIPELFLNDIHMFFRGKYSGFSNLLKCRILDSCGMTKYKGKNIPDVDSRIYQVVTKDKRLVEKMEKEFECSFDNIDLECKPIKEEEIWVKRETMFI